MDLKSKLKQVEDDLSQLRNDRAEKAKARDTAKEAFAKLDGYDVESAEYKAAESAIKAVSEVDEKIAQTQAAQVGILKMLGQQDPAAAPGARVEKTPSASSSPTATRRCAPRASSSPAAASATSASARSPAATR
jgi:DNA repair ATPase RecN